MTDGTIGPGLNCYRYLPKMKTTLCKVIKQMIKK